LNDWKLAKFHIEESLKYNPNLASSHLNLGILLSNHDKDHNKARYHFERALELMPTATADILKKVPVL
jgi:tetratricopeptide (TPR) repeat protein